MPGTLRDLARRSAAEAIDAATPEDRTRLAAELALRLAEGGHAKDITIDVDGTDEAAETVLAFFAERCRDEPQPAPAEAVLAPAGRNAQDAAGEAQGFDGGAYPPEGAGVIRSPQSVIRAGIVTEIREALAHGPLSFRALRVRIERGWKPARDALQALIDSGEVFREGARGQGVCFRLVARADAPAQAPAEGVQMQPDALPFDLADTWGLDAPAVFEEGQGS